MNSLHSMESSFSLKLLCAACFFIDIFARDGEFNKDGDAVTSALCPCDMTGGMCDVYCCCDEDCSEEASSAFTCDVAIHSDDSAKILHDWKCDNMNSEQGAHFSSFLCIQKANSPYLGHFFPPPKGIMDLPSLNLLLSKRRNFWENVEIPDSSLENKMLSSRTSSGYILGQTLEVQVTSAQGNREVKFLFPYNIHNGRCDLIHPLSFLKNIASSCTTEIRSAHDISLPNSLFSVSTFLMGNVSGRNLLSFPGNKTSFTNVSITYQHVASPCCYLNSVNCISPASCVKKVTASRNSFHDGPVCSNGTCRNIVLEVAYHFFWKGAKIIWLNITFTLGDVPLVGDQGNSVRRAMSGFLTQRFSAAYIYLPSFNASDMILNHAPLMRSGKYGYEIGLPLIGSTLVHNESDFEQDCTTGNKTYLYIPVYDVSRKCILEKVNFGQDLFSGCFIHLKLSNFTNCTAIRLRVLDTQSQVLQVSMISKSGDPDFQNTDDFVEVLGEEFPQNTSSDHEVIEELPWQRGISFCNNVPDHVQLHVLYTEAESIRGLPVYKVIGAIRRYQTNTWHIPCHPTESCHGDQSFTFPLTAAVHFSFISSIKDRKVKRFWAPSAPVSQCKEETCWEDILYPLMPSFTLHHVIDTANNCFIVLLFLLPFAWLKIRPS